MVDLDTAVAAMREANPVPDARAFHRWISDITTRPIELNDRSTPMQATTRIPTPEPRRPRREREHPRS